jgi:predicted lipoprotein with Yx(FWY)xxD motif
MKVLLSTLTIVLCSQMASALEIDVNTAGVVAAKAPVTEIQVGGRKILADRHQMTAYVFDRDTAGVSTCYAACASAWPAIVLAAHENSEAPFGETTRKDGARQLTYEGRPMYLFFGDKKPGDINGDGLQGIWHLIQADE